MSIRNKRIRNLQLHIGIIPHGANIRVGLSNPMRFETVLRRAGFPIPLVNGHSILPSSTIGPICRFNAEGKQIIHRDKRMEEVSRVREWHWTEWHGQERVEQSDFRDIPYKRYPRTPVLPPSIEISVQQKADSPVLVGPLVRYTDENAELIKHIINIFLELFRECDIFSNDLTEIILSPTTRLNWKLLPVGRVPWPQIRQQIENIVNIAPRGNRPYIWHRIDTIYGFNPEIFAMGTAGYAGYFIMGFPQKNIYVCESVKYGNATYVFDEEWRELSKKTKAEILNADLQTDRIVHKAGEWDRRIRQLLA
jgi:hypothetical protein